MRPNLSGGRRFELLSELGSGGMGTVYEAYDRDRSERVALKTLHDQSASSLVRFRREFRALQDIRHPNLIAIGELIEEDGKWFFTMELVQGQSFLEHVRCSNDNDGSALCDAERLRKTLAQLTHGLSALHEAGLVHRDIKPSNVLVREDGRPVILDFGLVTDTHASVRLTNQSALVGTIAYMAPEQAAAHKVGPAADWYSVGVMLYEALVGAFPFDGSGIQVLLDKQRHEPRAPRDIDPQVDEDLDALCRDLLRFEPAKRPSARQILARLGHKSVRPPNVVRPMSTGTSSDLLLGRERELAMMQEAFDAGASEDASVLYITGESGIGKSAIVAQFADLLAEQGRAIVLRGRCYEREAVRYKAFDGMFENLARHLQGLSSQEAKALLPEHWSTLVQVFPVLHQLSGRAARAVRILDPLESRSRLFAATRELLVRLSARAPLLITIDDLQWSDADSLALLAELVRGPDAPRMLLLGTLRRTAAESDQYDALFRLPCMTRQLEIAPLSVADSAALARCMLEHLHVSNADLALSIAEEAAGHPLFIAELVREAAMHSSEPGVQRSKMRLEDVLWARIERLESPACRLLQCVAVAGAPLSEACAARASGVTGAQFTRNAAILRVGQLVRTSSVRQADALETYHDRIREAVLARLGAEERKALHRAIANALAATHAEPEPIALHYHAAEEIESAAEYAAQAAAQASHALAFDRAAELYHHTVELRQRLHQDSRSLEVLLAEALSHAGRGAEAARVYLATAEGSTAAEALDLRRRAAQQLLMVGHIDAGLDALRSFLASEGMVLPKTRFHALVSMLYDRLRLRLRGLKFTIRDESELSARELARIDVCWHTARAMGWVERVRSVAFQSRSLWLALRAGEPRRVAMALTLDAMFLLAYTAATKPKRVERMLEQAESLTKNLADPYPLAFVQCAYSGLDFYGGRFRAMLVRLAVLEKSLREQCIGAHWELATVWFYGARCRAYLGEYKDLTRWLPSVMQDCRDRGDLYGETNLRTCVMPLVWLAQDNPELARKEVEDALSQWSQDGFHLQHHYALTSLASAHLYAGTVEDAHHEIQRNLPGLKKSMLLNVPYARYTFEDLDGRVSLALAAKRRGDRALLARVEGRARSLARSPLTWPRGLATTLRAGVLHVRGRHAACVRLLQEAQQLFDAAELAMHGACIRRRLGILTGGEHGDALRNQAEAWMRGQGVVNVAKMAALLVPGFE